MFLLQVTDNPIPTDLYNKGIALFHKTWKSKIEKFPEVIWLSTPWSHRGSNIVVIVCPAFQGFALL